MTLSEKEQAKARKDNKLINEKSPYLLQHAHNPVDWYPWSDEAFEKAKVEDKPIFLSIGYSTCHWCHVMERESFEDNEVAQFLNHNFVSIKVDREERPDIDHVYMNYCQTLTGQGGWPLSIFMTADKQAFFAGTYYPKLSRSGMPGFIDILKKIRGAWQDNRSAILEHSKNILNALKQNENNTSKDSDKDLIHEAYSQFKHSFDKVYGGFGNAPKFPTPHNLYFLIRYWYKTKESTALEYVEKTLDSMHRGGIFDHIGYGFCRYSTDQKWLAPHFEKMLYDNALLSIAYLETFQATKKDKYADIARQIFTYVLRDMTSSEGGFYSAEDADSEGEEGKYYLWTMDEIKQILGEEDGERFCMLLDISKEGNFEDANIPNLIHATASGIDEAFIEKCRQKLFERREKRVHPFKDDKILTSWNSLMIAALAIGGRVLCEKEYTMQAEKAFNFISEKLIRQDDGRLLARYRHGEASILAYVDDYAFLIWGLIELYETTYKPGYLKIALKLNDDLLKLFWDEPKGGLFMYGNDAEKLIIRPKEIYDGALPSGNSVSAMNFLRLARLTGNSKLEEKAQQQFKVFHSSVMQAPQAFSFYLSALLFSESKAKEIIIAGGSDYQGTEEMIKIVQKGLNPFIHIVVYTDQHKDLRDIIPIIKNYKTLEGKATAYICEGFSCQSPITNLLEFAESVFL